MTSLNGVNNIGNISACSGVILCTTWIYLHPHIIHSNAWWPNSIVRIGSCRVGHLDGRSWSKGCRLERFPWLGEEFQSGPSRLDLFSKWLVEAPDFPLTPGRYLVTSSWLNTTVLVQSKSGHWSLENGTVFNVTHLPDTDQMRDKGAQQQQIHPIFLWNLDQKMPAVQGCVKKGYAVIFVIGRESHGVREL